MHTARSFTARSRATRLLGAAMTALSLSGCDLSYECGTLLRTVATGTVRDAGNAALATATAEVREDIRPSFLHLSVGVMAPANTAGAPLRGHVTRARLVTESGQVIAEIPTSTATLYVDGVVALNMTVSRDEYDRVRALLLTNRTKVILETDLPARALVEATLVDAHDIPGTLSRCRPA